MNATVAELEVDDQLMVAIARDDQRLAVRLTADQARAVAGALTEYAARFARPVSGSTEPIVAGAGK